MIRIRLYLPLLISNIQRHLTSYHHTAAVCLYLHYPPNICSPLSDESRSHYALSSCLACGEETLNRDAEIHFHCSHTFTIHSHSGAPVNLQLSFHKVGIPSYHSWCVLLTTSVWWPSTNIWWIYFSLFGKAPGCNVMRWWMCSVGAVHKWGQLFYRFTQHRIHSILLCSGL